MRNSTWNCQETNSTSGPDVSLIQSLEIVKKVKCADCLYLWSCVVASMFPFGYHLQLLGSNVSKHSHFLCKITLFERDQTASLITNTV